MLQCMPVDLDKSRPFWCASEAVVLVLSCIVVVYNKKQLYILVDAKAGILLIYYFL